MKYRRTTRLRTPQRLLAVAALAGLSFGCSSSDDSESDAGDGSALSASPSPGTSLSPVTPSPIGSTPAGPVTPGNPVVGPPSQPPTSNADFCMQSDPGSISTELIDDMETGDGTLSASGRVGKWFASNDGATQQTPGDAQNLVMGMGIEGPGAGGSQYAVHSTLNVPEHAMWGGVIEVDFNSPSGAKDAADRQPINASAWDGVRFMAKGQGSVLVKLLSANTVPSNQGGTCNEGPGCHDSHQTSLSLSADWQQVTIHFSDLAQEGFGAAAPFEAGAVIGFALHAKTPGDYDIWVDNLEFFSEGATDCATYPGDPSCDVDMAYCTSCSSDPRCKCILEECESGVITGPLACSAESAMTRNGGSTRYWIAQASADRDTSGGYEALACALPVMSKGADGGSAATQDKVLGAPGGGTLFAALNSSDLGTDAALCGACVRINDSVTVQIVDECPNRPGEQGNPICTSGHLDLSVAAANQVGGDNPQISWKVVACENTAPEYIWLPNSQQYWGALAIAGLAYPARKVELKQGNTWIEGQRKPYWGPWIFGTDETLPGTSGQVPPSPWTVRITDMHGQVMVDTFASPSGGYANPVSGGVVTPYPSQGMVQLPVCGM